MTGRAPTVSVDGGRQLRASLKRAGVGVEDLKAAHKEVADDVARESRPNAPVLTGALVATTRGAGTQSAAIVRAGSARVPWAGPIHWGWPAHGIEARPWLAETAEEREPAWSATYLQAIETLIATVEGAAE